MQIFFLRHFDYYLNNLVIYIYEKLHYGLIHDLLEWFFDKLIKYSFVLQS